VDLLMAGGAAEVLQFFSIAPSFVFLVFSERDQPAQRLDGWR
jgi:hypothetical protein